METHDRWTSLFWLAFSIFVCIESLQLGIGKVRNPGMGFLAFGSSVLLGMLSLTLFVQALLKKEEEKTKQLFAGTLWKRLLFVLIALLMYAGFMPGLGYLVSTFLLMTLLFWILERKKLGWGLILSFLSTLITYYVFSVWLKGQFPEGPFGF
jgi:hypothetical protein